MKIKDFINLYIDKEIKNMKFEVGDIIKGTNDGPYNVTNEHMYAARVIKLNKSGNIEIQILNHLDKSNVGNTYIVDPKYFEYQDNDSDNDLYKNNLCPNNIVKIIEAPYGARGANGNYGILIDSKTAEKICEEEALFCYQGLGKNSDYFFIPFNSKYDSGEIWGFGKDFTKIKFKDITTRIIYNKESKKMTIEEIEKELGYKIELIQ